MSNSKRFRRDLYPMQPVFNQKPKFCLEFHCSCKDGFTDNGVVIGNTCKDWHSKGLTENKWCILGTNPKAASCPGATKKTGYYWTKHPFICTGKEKIHQKTTKVEGV